MRSSCTLANSSLWLLVGSLGCSTVIGIDGDYTDLASAGAESGGAAGSGLSGSGEASAGKSGSAAQAGSTAAGGSNAQGGSSPQAGTGGQASVKCTGVSSSGVCWHLGSLGDSCKETCSDRGGVSLAAASVIGTTAQGGSLDKCAALLDALGESSKPTEAKRTDDNGVGCHYYALKTYWLSAPDYNDTAHLSSARIVCGCVQ